MFQLSGFYFSLSQNEKPCVLWMAVCVALDDVGASTNRIGFSVMSSPKEEYWYIQMVGLGLKDHRIGSIIPTINCAIHRALCDLTFGGKLTESATPYRTVPK